MHGSAAILVITVAVCGLIAPTLRPSATLPEAAGQGGKEKTTAGDIEAVLAFWAQCIVTV